MNKTDFNKGELVQIPIEDLYPHFGNPRKDLGDLTELTDSIKAKGIMQNLTVVPKIGGDGYTVIIGHRRLAASKMAGLKTLPCVIVDMEPKDQMATMLLENMQRSDLTFYEQAQGFQMMFDLGDTVEDIAAKSGFSKTTIRKRLKLTALDGDKFRAAETRGGTLDDYIAVAEIKDEKARDKVTDAIGTSNFNWELKSALKKQELKEKMPTIKKEMKSIGAKKDDNIRSWDSKYEKVMSVNVSDYKEGCIKKKTKANTEYWYNIQCDNTIDVYKKSVKPKKQVVKKSDKELAANERRKKLADISQRAYELRRDFIREFVVTKDDAKAINDWSWELHYRYLTGSYTYTDIELICEKVGEEYEKYKYNVERANLDKYIAGKPKNAPAVILYAKSGDNKSMTYYSANSGEIMPAHKENKSLDFIYERLCALGYEMSDEEKALQDGTHELFAEDKNDNE